MEQKFRKIGIDSEQEIIKITKCGPSIAHKVWMGRRPLSLKMALKIRKVTGASLDYLYS